MSRGTSTLAVHVSTAAKTMATVGQVFSRSAVTVTVQSSVVSAANLILLAFRNGTLVAQCGSFTGGTPSGTMDLDTSQMATVNTDGKLATVMLDLRLWDTSTLDLVASGRLEVIWKSDDYGTDTGSTGSIVVQSPAGWYFETIDGISYFVAKDAAGVVYMKIPAPGAVPNE